MNPKMSRKALTDEALELVALRFRVLGEANRLKLVRALQQGEQNVSQLVELTGLAQANASRHLQALTQAGILGRRQDGNRAVYSLADKGILALCEQVCGSLQQRAQKHAKAFNV